MDAVVTGEAPGVLGLGVVDNRDVEHLIDVRTADGAIPGHESAGYPDDPADRTPEENERVDRARRFARYHVYRKRGHPTVPARRNPDLIRATAVALADCPTDRVEALFGDLHRQVRGHCRDERRPGGHHRDERRPVAIPEPVSGTPVYRQDVYLGLDDAGAERVAEAVATEVMDAAREGDRETVEALLENPGSVVATTPGDPAGELLREAVRIEAVSGLELRWEDPAGRVHTRGGEAPSPGHGGDPDLDRAPDARLEVPPFDPGPVEGFRWRLVRHLVCQVRDCYLGMGIAPPDPYRVLGPGTVDAATRYEHLDCYDRYHDPDASVDAWFEDHTPEGAYEAPTPEGGYDHVA